MSLGVVGVGGGEVQAGRIDYAGEHTVGRVVGVDDMVAPRIDRLGQPVGLVVDIADDLPQCIGDLYQVSVPVVAVQGTVASPVGDGLGLAEAVVHDLGDDPFGRRHRHRTVGVAVDEGGRIVEGVLLGEYPVKRVVGGARAEVQMPGARIDGPRDHPPELVVAPGAHVAVGVGGLGGTPEGVVHRRR